MDSEETKARPRYGVANFERMAFPRFSVDLPVEYERLDSFIPGTGRTENVSAGGLLIYFPERMEIGQCLKLKLSFVSGRTLNTIEVVVEVVWVEVDYDRGWGEYRSGVKFVDILPDDMIKLKKFLMDLSQPPYAR